MTQKKMPHLLIVRKLGKGIFVIPWGDGSAFSVHYSSPHHLTSWYRMSTNKPFQNTFLKIERRKQKPKGKQSKGRIWEWKEHNTAMITTLALFGGETAKCAVAWSRGRQLPPHSTRQWLAAAVTSSFAQIIGACHSGECHALPPEEFLGLTRVASRGVSFWTESTDTSSWVFYIFFWSIEFSTWNTICLLLFLVFFLVEISRFFWVKFSCFLDWAFLWAPVGPFNSLDKLDF